VRVAVIGLGDIASKAYLPLLAGWEGIELLPFSRRPETVARIRERYRLPHAGGTEWDELMAARPAAAFVLSPSGTHFEIAGRLLAAGVDVYLEKPATLRSVDTAALAEQAEAAGRVLMVGFNRRYAPLHVRARELWGGRRIELCTFSKHRASAVHPDLFSNYIDDTIHIIDLLRFFAGDARAVRTSAEVRDGRLVGALSLLGLAAGGHGMVATSLDAGGWSESYALHGEGASLEIDAFSSLRLTSDGREQVISTGAGGWGSTLEARGFPQQIAHFLDCVRTRAVPLTSARESERTQKLLEDLVAAAG
jgi:virulence factor